MSFARRQHGLAKPPQGTQIDRTNGLSAGLYGAWLFNEGGGQPRDLMRGSTLELRTGASWSGSAAGGGMTTTGATNGGLFNQSIAIPFSQALTVLWMGINTTLNTSAHAVSNDGPTRCWINRANTSTAVNWHTWTNTALAQYFPANSWAVGKQIVSVCQSRVEAAQLRQTVWLDGRLCGTQLTQSGVTSLTTGTSRLNVHTDGGSSAYAGTVDMILLWNRYLSPGEVAAISLAPFSLLVPNRTWSFPTGAAAVGRSYCWID